MYVWLKRASAGFSLKQNARVPWRMYEILILKFSELSKFMMAASQVMDKTTNLKRA
jgi:hypothetical protein